MASILTYLSQAIFNMIEDVLKALPDVLKWPMQLSVAAILSVMDTVAIVVQFISGSYSIPACIVS